ncbi:MAG: hypothetical protein ACYC9S_10430 [Leptospirales bacterium]
MEESHQGVEVGPEGRWELLGQMIREIYEQGESLFSIRSPGGVAELYAGQARKISCDGSSFTIEREDWHLHFRLESVEQVRFDLSKKENGGLRMAIILENAEGTPLLRAAWLPRLMPPDEPPALRFWKFCERYKALQGCLDDRDIRLAFPDASSDKRSNISV